MTVFCDKGFFHNRVLNQALQCQCLNIVFCLSPSLVCHFLTRKNQNAPMPIFWKWSICNIYTFTNPVTGFFPLHFCCSSLLLYYWNCKGKGYRGFRGRTRSDGKGFPFHSALQCFMTKKCTHFLLKMAIVWSHHISTVILRHLWCCSIYNTFTSLLSNGKF